MAKNPTKWTNNDIKPATAWVAPAKSITAWRNNDIKPATLWANNDVKHVTAWGITGTGQQSYFYDDPTMTYDMSNATYEALLTGNTLNQRVLTQWSAV